MKQLITLVLLGTFALTQTAKADGKVAADNKKQKSEITLVWNQSKAENWLQESGSANIWADNTEVSFLIYSLSY